MEALFVRTGSDRRSNDAARADCASAQPLPAVDSRSPPAPELPSAGSGPVVPVCSAAGYRVVPSVAGCVDCRGTTFVPGYVGCHGMAFVPRYVVDCL